MSNSNKLSAYTQAGIFNMVPTICIWFYMTLYDFDWFYTSTYPWNDPTSRKPGDIPVNPN